MARSLEIPASFGDKIATWGKAVTTRLNDVFASVGSPQAILLGTTFFGVTTLWMGDPSRHRGNGSDDSKCPAPLAARPRTHE